MIDLKNHTPFAAHYVLLPNEVGVDTLYVNVKASFNIGQTWTLCDNQPEPLHEDIYWGEPGQSSLRLPIDVHQGKPNTDIAIIGSAHAPNGKPVKQLDVSATVGSYEKKIRIFGDRFWQHGQITAPREFTQMPLRYEYSFGGRHIDNGQLISLEKRNPVGKGYSGTNNAQQMESTALPNIEDPDNLIRAITDSPAPTGFGFIAPNWYPRAAYAGNYDEQWQRKRAPYLPLDYNSNFQNSAHPDLIANGYLQGGEEVVLNNMHPNGTIHFALPIVRLAGNVIFSNQPEQDLKFVMETLVIDLDTWAVGMVWKASCECSNAFSLIRNMKIHLLR